MYLQYHARRHRISLTDIGVAPVVILTWGSGVVRSLVSELHAKQSAQWSLLGERSAHPLFTGEHSGQRTSVVMAPEGAAATVMMMEELIACGAEVILGLGWAGGVQRAAGLGTVYIPSECISDEGTSPHYGRGVDRFRPDAQLAETYLSTATARRVRLRGGRHWTTDAPYRETVARIGVLRRRGVIGVDMETSAMYAAGRFRGVRVCNILVISDELWGPWKPGFNGRLVRRGTETAQRVLLEALNRVYPVLAPSPIGVSIASTKPLRGRSR